MIYIIAARPYKFLMTNVLNILTDLFAAIQFFMNILFLNLEGKPKESYDLGWIMIGLLGAYSLFGSIITIVACFKELYSERIYPA